MENTTNDIASGMSKAELACHILSSLAKMTNGSPYCVMVANLLFGKRGEEAKEKEEYHMQAKS